MRRDERLLAAAEADPAFPAVWRLFRFAPHGVTLGRAQDPARTLDLPRCQALAVPWAVRPTGGRAIFHAEEWTYSVTARLDDPCWGGSLALAYARASQAIVESLLLLGVPARLARAAPADPGPRAAVACFATTSRHEIVLEGRKLVGSAQRRTATALLQQGSVLLGEGHHRLADVAAGDEPARAAVRASLARARGAAPWLAPDAPLELWAGALGRVLSPARILVGDAGLALLAPRATDASRGASDAAPAHDLPRAFR